jgi:hypothetical protein
MRLFRRLLLLILFITLSVPIVLAFLTFEDTPAVYKTDLIDTEKAARAKDLTRKTLRQILRYNKAEDISISASEDDLNSLMAVTARGIHRIEGHINVTRAGLYADMTVRLPHNPAGDYINIHFGVFPSESGFHVSPVSIGYIRIPGRLALFIVRVMLDIILGNDNGTVAVNSLQSVEFTNDTVTFHIRKIPDLLARKNKIVQRFKSLRDAMPLLADPEIVREYYVKLMELGNRIQPGQQASLAYFIGPLFELAQKRSLNSDPAEENKAALLALAIYTGDSRFEPLIGQVRTETMKRYRPRYRHVLLGGREDLRLHFVISAGLKIISDSGLTNAVGEYKELLDARKGGSGFSFVDLAADLAGTRLAEAATDHSGDAGRIQSALAGEVSEDMFFPNVSDLPEDISQNDFEHTYGNVENPKYLSLVGKIKDRISRLPAYSRE